MHGPIAHLPVVAGGENGEDARRPPGRHVGPEGGIGPVHVAPGVVDHVGGFAGIRVLSAEVGGGQDPLEALMDLHIVGEAKIIEDLDGDPVSAGGHADLIRAPVVPHDGAHGVGAVVVSVSGGTGISVSEIIPVVVVVAVRAPVLALQRGVGPVCACVHAGHHHPAPGDAEIAPHLIGPHLGDVPLHWLEIGNWRLDVGGWMLEIGGWRLEI